VGIYYQPPPAPTIPPVPLQNLPPALLAVRGDAPPVMCGANDPDVMWNILRMHDAPDPQPRQTPPSAIPALYPKSVDNPPVMCGANDPDLYLSIRSWDDPAPWPIQGKRSIVSPLYPIIISNPPLNNRGQLINLIRAWDQAEFRIPSPSQFPQATIINLPPFTQLSRTSAFQTLVQSWIPPDPMPPRSSINLAPAISVIRGDNPPVMCGANDPDLYLSIRSWDDPAPWPMQGKRSIVSPLYPMIVSNPPLNNRGQLMNLIRAWDATDLRIPSLVKLPQLTIINLPPFTQLSRTSVYQTLIQSWMPPDPMPPRSLLNVVIPLWTPVSLYNKVRLSFVPRQGGVLFTAKNGTVKIG